MSNKNVVVISVINVLVISIGPNQFVLFREHVAADHIIMERCDLGYLKTFFSRPFFFQMDRLTEKFLGTLGVVLGLDNLKITARMSTNIVDFIVCHITFMCNGDMKAVRAVTENYLSSGLLGRGINTIAVALRNRFMTELIASDFFQDCFVFCSVMRVSDSQFFGIQNYEPQLFALSQKFDQVVIEKNMVKRRKLRAEFLVLLKNPRLY